MPYSLSELNAMSEEQLRSLADSLNIKGAKKMDLPTLGYAILDTQAEIESRKPAPPKVEKKTWPATQKPCTGPSDRGKTHREKARGESSCGRNTCSGKAPAQKAWP